MPDGSVLWRNVYQVHKDPHDAIKWVGLARINKQYSPVTTTALSWAALEGKTWKTTA